MTAWDSYSQIMPKPQCGITIHIPECLKQAVMTPNTGEDSEKLGHPHNVGNIKCCDHSQKEFGSFLKFK